jgi:NADH:ubiquinone oxidoreductase subunit 4 (subunit M)
MIMFGLFSHNSIMVALASINMITGAAYTLWAYNRIAFGNIKDIYIKYHFDLTRIEFYLYFFLTVLLFAMGLFPNFFLEYLHDWVYTLPFLYY